MGRMIKHHMLLAAVGVAALGLGVACAACGESDNRDPVRTASSTGTPETTGTPTPTSSQVLTPQPTTTTPATRAAPPGLHSPDTRVGDSRVDDVLAALEQLNGGALGDLVVTTKLACGQGVGIPPCSGQPTGTLVEVFPAGGCAPQFFDEAEGKRQVAALADGGQYFLYVVYSKPDEFGPPAAEFTLVLATALDGDARRLMVDTQGSIVRMNGTCGNPVGGDAVVVAADARVVLAPVR